MKICWNITNKCNLNCQHCFRNNTEHAMALVDNLKLLEKLVGVVDSISFSGGEVLLYPDFLSILKKAKDLGFTCSFTTNGMLCDIKHIDMFIKYIDKITFSIDYIDDNLNVVYGRGENYYKHNKEIIKHLIINYPQKLVKVNTVLTKTNFAFLDDIYKELLTLKVMSWKIMEFCPLRGNAIKNRDNFVVNEEIIKKIKKDIENFNGINVIFEDKENVQNQIVISPEGNLCVGKNDKDVIILENLLDKKKETIKAVLLDNIREENDEYINLNLYKMFYEVARAGSITAASKKLYISQPAISKSILKLETNLGVKLFYRTNNDISLTKNGAKIFYYIEEAFNNIALAERYLNEEEDYSRGKINIGVPSHIGTFYIFEKLKEFHKEFPNIEINIMSRRTNELLELLSKKELDIVIDSSPIELDDSNFSIIKLKKVRNCLFCSKDADININEIKSLKDLKEKPLILPVKKSSHRQTLENLANNNDVVFKTVMSIETSEMIINAVKSGLGIGYVVYDLVKDDIKSGIFHEIKVRELLPEVQLNLIYNEKNLTLVPKNFIKEYLLVDNRQ